MYKEEIKKQKWRVDSRVTYTDYNQTSIPAEEQECHINMLREGFQGKPEILVDCTHQGKITELCKSEFFYLKDVVLSTHQTNKGFVLGIRGNLDANAVTIRKTKPTKAQIELARKRAQKNFGQKKK